MQGVYKSITAVMTGLAKEGITKDRKNKEQGYQFRGIDDVYNALSGLLSENNLCILPRVLSRDMKERQSKNGGALFNVVVEVEFDFVNAEDGSKHTVKTYGEAMDSADKATNKAMSAAYKYACIQAFCIPTEGDNDADATTPDVGVDKPSIFETLDLRDKFKGNLIESLQKAASVIALNDLIALDKARIIAMRSSKNSDDVLAGDEIHSIYRNKLVVLKQAEAVGVKPSVQAVTVEQAIKQQSTVGVLGDDEIPF
jgi:ERF superfamily